MPEILTDQPTTTDTLNRAQYANAFSRIALDARTPLVVGLFGDWGAGKTSLMRMIAERLAAEGVRTVWFDAWQHQDDESPVLALIHTMVDQLDLGEEGRKLLTVIATAFGSAWLRATTTVHADELTKFGERYEAERFLVRDTRVRLASHFKALVRRAKINENERLVFFIDDLDRCAAGTALAVLEALKLYLNLDGCIYFLGADRRALERAVTVRHGTDPASSARYLDKVVQLPFVIPPIHDASMRGFVGGVLPEELHDCEDLLVAGLGGNPRAVKRFINVLSLNHELAMEARMVEYDPRILALLLLVQYHDADRFTLLSSDPSLLAQMIASRADEQNQGLRAVFDVMLKAPPNLAQYIFLTQIASTPETVTGSNPEFLKPFVPDAALGQVVGTEPQPRTEITKRLWSYIRAKGLQDSRNGPYVRADELLAPVFAGKAQVSMFEMAKLVNRHLRPFEGEPARYDGPVVSARHGHDDDCIFDENGNCINDNQKHWGANE